MPVTRHLGLGVIETRWFGEHHHTVRPLFEFLSYALKNRPDAFTYERFVGATSFREAVRFMTASGDVDYLYIAAHGDFTRIEAPDGSALSRTFLRNTICEVNRKQRQLKGVMFGSCKFGDARNLIEVLRPARIRGQTVRNRLIWAAGYGKEIDYTRSSLFDIYFYDMLFRNGGNGDEITRLQNTVDKLNRAVPGMIDSLCLSIVVRLPNGRYRNIIQQEVYPD